MNCIVIVRCYIALRKISIYIYYNIQIWPTPTKDLFWGCYLRVTKELLKRLLYQMKSCSGFKLLIGVWAIFHFVLFPSYITTRTHIQACPHNSHGPLMRQEHKPAWKKTFTASDSRHPGPNDGRSKINLQWIIAFNATDTKICNSRTDSLHHKFSIFRCRIGDSLFTKTGRQKQQIAQRWFNPDLSVC